MSIGKVDWLWPGPSSNDCIRPGFESWLREPVLALKAIIEIVVSFLTLHLWLGPELLPHVSNMIVFSRSREASLGLFLGITTEVNSVLIAGAVRSPVDWARHRVFELSFLQKLPQGLLVPRFNRLSFFLFISNYLRIVWVMLRVLASREVVHNFNLIILTKKKLQLRHDGQSLLNLPLYELPTGHSEYSLLGV